VPKIDSKCFVILNCGQLQVFVVLKLRVLPTQWLKFDMPDVVCVVGYNPRYICQDLI